MSAYIVEDKTINNIMASLVGSFDEYLQRMMREKLKNIGYDLHSQKDQYRLAMELFRVNCESIEQRYGKGEAEKFRPLNYRYESAISLPAIMFYKTLQCWLYQSCEGNVSNVSIVFKAMQEIADMLAHHIVIRSDEYDKASGW